MMLTIDDLVIGNLYRAKFSLDSEPGTDFWIYLGNLKTICIDINFMPVQTQEESRYLIRYFDILYKDNVHHIFVHGPQEFYDV